MGALCCCQARGRASAHRLSDISGHRLLGIARLPGSDSECCFLNPAHCTPLLGAGARGQGPKSPILLGSRM